MATGPASPLIGWLDGITRCCLPVRSAEWVLLFKASPHVEFMASYYLAGLFCILVEPSSVRGKNSIWIIYVPLQEGRGHNLTNVWGELVSQGDATEKLAHQVPAQTASAYCGLEEASGDPHAEEKDEAHKSSKGHVSVPVIECHISLEALAKRISPPELNMEDEDMEELRFQSLSKQRTKTQSKQKRGSTFFVKTKDRQHRSRPPD
ncbi:hypothetical protein DPEC_G00177260 [Dallia pectoralis]|uniref:Uncharacterized protein n=1 Tax=Dallia pectoralis TaxID=75939 RepID=A0ACC2GEU5_DALPE|nr:hypothetical protein DPEC_G00177260 [Dallia pectoralis]